MALLGIPFRVGVHVVIRLRRLLALSVLRLQFIENVDVFFESLLIQGCYYGRIQVLRLLFSKSLVWIFEGIFLGLPTVVEIKGIGRLVDRVVFVGVQLWEILHAVIVEGAGLLFHWLAFVDPQLVLV